MDESLGECTIDISGRPFCRYSSEVPEVAIAGFDSELAEEFFRAVASNAKLTLHVGTRYGSNAHHLIEASFKAFASALREAVVDRSGRARRALHQGYAHLVTRIAILDYGMGNLRSARRRSSAWARRPSGSPTSPPRTAPTGWCCQASERSPRRCAGFARLASTAWPATGRRPGGRCSGICLGMQLLFELVDRERGAEGLGLLDGDVTATRRAGPEGPAHGLGAGALGARVPVCARRRATETPFYFVHSFVARPANPDVVVGTAEWGERFAAVVEHGSVLRRTVPPREVELGWAEDPGGVRRRLRARPAPDP